ncbi:MAG: S8 family serine peptidase [Bacteroidota bacterium]
MNKIIISLLLLTSVAVKVYSQPKNKQKDRIPVNWEFQAADGKYIGASIEKAYEYIQEQGIEKKKEIVVAVIEGGVDLQHEDIKNVLWVNEDEIPGNGIDDDKNGYIDDVNGWNFLGNVNGKNLVKSSLEADREFFRLINEFEQYGIDSTQVPIKQMDEYLYFRYKVIKNSKIGKAYESNEAMKSIVAYADTFTIAMQLKYNTAKTNFSFDQFNSISPAETESINKLRAFIYYAMGFGFKKRTHGADANWNHMLESRQRLTEKTQTSYDKLLAEGLYNRDIIGDDINNIKDKYYGNNNIDATHTDHGTHVAGIIGADRNNKLGMKGVADVKLMNIRAIPEGDEYDKDVALAILYAVDNGANIINLSFGKPISTNKKWVDKALKKAEKKGVLIVHAAGNSYQNIDEDYIYPVKYITTKKVLTNFITIGSVNAYGNPAITSNYGATAVDVFAPGVDIYSTIVGDNYKKMNGTSMAAPVVTGIAALVWSYFPDLSVQELIEVLRKGVTNMTGKEVEKPKDPKMMIPRKKIAFEEICSWNGIINAYNAIKLAHELQQ